MGSLSCLLIALVVIIAIDYSAVEAVKCCNRWFAPFGMKTPNKFACKDGCTNADKCFKYIYDGTYCLLFTRGGAKGAAGFRPLSRNRFAYCWKQGKCKGRGNKQGIFKKVQANEQQCSQMCDQSNDCASNYFRKDTQECLLISCKKGSSPKPPATTKDCTKNCASSYGSYYKMQKQKHKSPFDTPAGGAPTTLPPPPPPNNPRDCCNRCRALKGKCRYYIYVDGSCMMYTTKTAKLPDFENCQELTGCKMRPGPKKPISGYIKKKMFKKVETNNKECTKVCGKSENCRESLFLSEQATCIIQTYKKSSSRKPLKVNGKKFETCDESSDCKIGPPTRCR
ncbi:uncharacterized protein LOC135498018 [Lineus longissimus]|uniref:uncharacterized protein LOC135498018 n=1 Tax=Lineus longissimus TaxID=88925 RepID=UPI002B4E6E0B